MQIYVLFLSWYVQYIFIYMMDRYYTSLCSSLVSLSLLVGAKETNSWEVCILKQKWAKMIPPDNNQSVVELQLLTCSQSTLTDVKPTLIQFHWPKCNTLYMEIRPKANVNYWIIVYRYITTKHFKAFESILPYFYYRYM